LKNFSLSDTLDSNFCISGFLVRVTLSFLLEVYGVMLQTCIFMFK